MPRSNSYRREHEKNNTKAEKPNNLYLTPDSEPCCSKQCRNNKVRRYVAITQKRRQNKNSKTTSKTYLPFGPIFKSRYDGKVTVSVVSKFDKQLSKIWNWPSALVAKAKRKSGVSKGESLR